MSKHSWHVKNIAVVHHLDVCFSVRLYSRNSSKESTGTWDTCSCLIRSMIPWFSAYCTISRTHHQLENSEAAFHSSVLQTHVNRIWTHTSSTLWTQEVTHHYISDSTDGGVSGRTMTVNTPRWSNCGSGTLSCKKCIHMEDDSSESSTSD